MENIICPGCKRSITPDVRLEKDKKKGGRTYKITYCPFERCKFNLDIEKIEVKLWNKEGMFFEDYMP